LSDHEDYRFYRVREDPIEYALWKDFRKRGSLFGVTADEVPALVRSGVDVWSLGYGWDQGDLEEGEYTTIGVDDLWAFDEAPDVVDSWGPFAASRWARHSGRQA
jgi:hypothetical protein